jgi:acyl-CoA thioester hydrolase
MGISPFSKNVEVRWSDLDPNFHLRHSVYYDFGAFVRIAFLESVGLGMHIFIENHFGPVIFREECVFKKEVLFGDKLTITASLLKTRKDYSRWTIIHEVWKNDETLAAILTVDGAWMDTTKRKLYLPDEKIQAMFAQIPKHDGFQFESVPDKFQ